MIRPEQPSEEFVDKERYQEHTSIQKIQMIVGMAVADESFREHFLQDPVIACHSAGYDLTSMEKAALRNLKKDVIKAFDSSLDERISKIKWL